MCLGAQGFKNVLFLYGLEAQEAQKRFVYTVWHFKKKLEWKIRGFREQFPYCFQLEKGKGKREDPRSSREHFPYCF